VGFTTAYCEDLLLYDVVQPCTYHWKCTSYVVEEELKDGVGEREERLISPPTKITKMWQIQHF